MREVASPGPSAVAYDGPAQHQPAAPTNRLQDARDQQTADRRRPAGDGARRRHTRMRAVISIGRRPNRVGNRAVEQLSTGNAEQDRA